MTLPAQLPVAVDAALNRFAAISLARLPTQPVTARTFQQVYDGYMADLAARLNAGGIPYNVAGQTGAGTINVVTDTYAITGRAFAYRVAAVEQARDDAVASVLTPWSYGAFLDALGATQEPKLERKPLVASPRAYADYPEDWEGDEPFRARILLAPEALSTCGPEGAYLWFALLHALVLAAACYGPMSFGGTAMAPFIPPGHVDVVIVSEVGDGTASADLVAAVLAELRADSRRPIGDFVNVFAAAIVRWTLSATLYVGPGFDVSAVALTALARARAVADFQHRPGGAALAQALYAALYVPDASGVPVVGYVDLGGFADVNPGPITAANPGPAYAAPYCAPGAGLPSAAPVTINADGIATVTWGDMTIRVVQSGG